MVWLVRNLILFSLVQFPIIVHNRLIGKMKLHFPFGGCTISFNCMDEQEFWAALYVLLTYMVHEDDLFLV